MGAGQSTGNDSTKHVFTSDTPIQFSPELIDSLQASSETNSTRAKSLELHIAQRVAAELEKLKSKESEALENIRKKIASSGSDSDPDASSSDSLLTISPKDLLLLESAEEKARKSQTTQKVQQEIEKLRQTLGQRKVVKDLPKEVETARQDVISCLRLNDRRPLDCWKEVEVFKREVRKLEENYVSSVI